MPPPERESESDLSNDSSDDIEKDIVQLKEADPSKIPFHFLKTGIISMMSY